MGSLAKFLTDLSVVANEVLDVDSTSTKDYSGILKQALDEAAKAVSYKRWNKVADYELEDVRYEVSKAAKEIMATRYAASSPALDDIDEDDDNYLEDPALADVGGPDDEDEDGGDYGDEIDESAEEVIDELLEDEDNED